MNKQRKVLITTTYNEMGIIIDTKAEEVAQPNLPIPPVNPQEPKTGHWIPVSERLPDEYGEYLITWTTSQSKRPFIGISEGEVTSEYDHEHNRFKVEWLLEDYVKNYPDVKVIAWMPLPEPYKAESEET